MESFQDSTAIQQTTPMSSDDFLAEVSPDGAEGMTHLAALNPTHMNNQG